MGKFDFLSDQRFAGLAPFAKKVWLASPTMHGEEQKYVDEAIRTNWVSTVGENIDEVERRAAKEIGCGYGSAAPWCQALWGKTLRTAETWEGGTIWAAGFLFGHDL